jgi:5'-nucleotidase/UDP-sugar diphosphatase
MGVIGLSLLKPRKIFIALMCLALICGLATIMPFSKKAEAAEELLFTILHTNDEHSEIIPYGPASDYPDYPTTGGFSRIANEIGTIKAQKAAEGEPVLTLSAGDFSQGTLFGWIETQAAAELTLLKEMGYDAVALGNHEFDEGALYRAMVLNQAKNVLGIKLPILCSNIQFDLSNPSAAALHAFWSDTDLQGTQLAIQPYTIKTLSNGLKVGIFGLLGVEAEAVAPAAALDGVTFGNVPGHPEDNVSFLNRVIKSQEMVDTLRAAGCQVVVALSHSGTYEESTLAGMVRGIDVIVGGHSHDLNYPPITVGNTTIVQAGAYGAYLGDLELEYANDKVSVRNAQAIKIDQNVASVPAIDAAINANYVAALNAATGMDILAPKAETDLAGDGGFSLYDNPAFCETNVGDLITDSYKTVTTALNPTKPTVLGFEASGVIRGGIPKGGRGQFSFYDLIRTIPLGISATEPPPAGSMGYSMVSFYLFGAEIEGVMEATLDMGESDFFVQLSGGKYRYLPSGPSGSKITSFEVSDGAGGWVPLNPAGLYKVATNWYTASFLAMFGVNPRTEAGAPTTVDASIVKKPDLKELKCWEALYGYVMGMPDLDADGLPNIIPVYATPQGRIVPSSWYLAEGSTDGGMETFVLVQNPGDSDAHVNIKFQTDTEEIAPAELQGVVIPAKSRRTFKANSYVTNYNVSTTVEPIDGEVVVERSMYGNNRTWAHDSIGVTSPTPAWYLAEGSTDGGMETWVLVQNPQDKAAQVNIKFQTDQGEVAPAALQGVTIPAQSRQSFKVNDYVTSYDVSTFIETLDGGIICERAMYGNNRTWATDSIGYAPLPL